MDLFEILFFFVFAQGMSAILKFNFYVKFLGAKNKKLYYLAYVLFVYIVSVLVNYWPQSYWGSTLLNLFITFCAGYFMLKATGANAALALILTESVNMLCFGVISSFVSILSPILIPISGNFSYVLSLGSVIVSLLLSFICYSIILKKYHLTKAAMKRYFSIFFLPVLCVLLACGYITDSYYGNVIVMDSMGVIQPGVNHFLMLFIQCIVGSLLFCTLYGCQKLSDGVAVQTRLALLEHEIQAQKDYLQETRTRYEQTQAFRHDIKGHLTALRGLLENNEAQKAKSYLEKLDDISENLSFICKTGNTVVDTLLSSKLSAARQNNINIECTVKIPSLCCVDDLDLCVLFSNAVDNAVRACSLQENDNKFIRISGKEKGDFFMIEIENSCSKSGSCERGIGLTNIEAVAAKYHGAVTFEKQEDLFSLNALLIISRSLNNISV